MVTHVLVAAALSLMAGVGRQGSKITKTSP